MITEDIKMNINRIDFELKEVFDKVKISEKADNGGYFFDIKTSSTFIFEDESKRRANINVKIYKQDIVNNNIRWFYQSNPLNEKSNWVERVSNIKSISEDITNIVILKQMDEDYLNSLEEVMDLITESSNDIILETKDKIEKVFVKYGVITKYLSKNNDIVFENNQFMERKPDFKLLYSHVSDIKMSDKFMIESEINKIPGVNYTIFKEGFEIEIDITN